MRQHKVKIIRGDKIEDIERKLDEIYESNAQFRLVSATDITSIQRNSTIYEHYNIVLLTVWAHNY